LELMRRLLEWSAWRGAGLLAGAIFLGLFVPPLASAARGAITPIVFLLMVLVLLRVDPAQVIAYLRRPLLVAALLAWLLVASPLILWALLWTLGITHPFAAGLVIVATGCAATSSPAFARLVGLDGEIAFVVAMLSTLILPFTAPPLALGLLGIDLAISVTGLMLRLALLVGLPLLISIVLRRWMGPARLDRWGRAVDGAVVLLVVLYGFGVMDGVLAQLVAAPALVLTGIAIAFAGALAMNAMTALAFAGFGRRVALSAGLMAGNRNMALYLAVIPATADPHIILSFVLFQFPLFLSPFLLKPVYERIRAPAKG
jgi:BASS family bile acid:Na+ symporter